MDIPKGGKLLEVILNIFNYRYIFNIVSYIFNINYHKIKYYKHDYRFIKTPYSWKMIDNFNNIKNRYKFIYLNSSHLNNLNDEFSKKGCCCKTL